MNWVKELCDLYDKNQSAAGIIETGRYGEPLVLTPVFHVTVTAQITVTIDVDGNFLWAERVPDEEKMTLIPVTEKSAVRTSGVEAHPLCDNLKYLAGDYQDFVIPDKKKDFSENHRMYMEGLRKWSESEFSHEKVSAICRYLEKGSLMKDLIKKGILILNENQKVSDKEKIQNVGQADAFVRFCVEKKQDGDVPPLFDERAHVPKECWRDISLQNAYISYVRSQKKTCGLSYLTGNIETITYLHPKKIRNEGDGAKLISSNDEMGFTFRGRFANKEEAFAIGYEDSQKAHNALKWIIRKQGKNWNGLYVVSWESDLGELPDWSVGTDKACEQYEEWESWEDGEKKKTYDGTDPKTAARFHAAIAGYQKAISIKANSQTMLMAFDAATTGRLAIMACQEFSTSMYLKNLNQWHENCGWLHPRYKDKVFYEYYGIVGVRDIANLLYGTENKGDMVLKGNAEKMLSETCKRLLPCILSGRPIPEDMVRLAVRRASSPVSYENRMNWRRTMALACSFVKKKNMEKSGEVWTVALNKERRDRSYLYGRLLAVADRIEYLVYAKERPYRKKDQNEEEQTEERQSKSESKESRETNARRFMNSFSQNPFRTWKIIEERVEPYKEKLALQEKLYYEHLIEEIFWNFEEGDYEKSDPLNGLYLLGFHNQAYALRKKEEGYNERPERKD